MLGDLGEIVYHKDPNCGQQILSHTSEYILSGKVWTGRYSTRAACVELERCNSLRLGRRGSEGKPVICEIGALYTPTFGKRIGVRLHISAANPAMWR